MNPQNRRALDTAALPVCVLGQLARNSGSGGRTRRSELMRLSWAWPIRVVVVVEVLQEGIEPSNTNV